MGKIISKLTGADKAAKAATESAAIQSAAIRASSEAAANSARENAAQAARSQEGQAARNAAEGAAQDALSKPLDNADVQLDAANGASAAGTAKKRRASFGVGYSSGVNI